jgi:N-acetylglutamate synthase
LSSVAVTEAETRRWEELTLATAPAIQQWLYDGWVVRASGNDVRRANSATAIYPCTLPLDEKIAEVEAWYQQHQQPAMFRLNTILTPPALEPALVARGYRREMDTFMMTANLASFVSSPAVPLGLRLVERASEEGIKDVHRLKGTSELLALRDAARQSLWRGEERYLSLKSVNGLVCTGMARLHRGHVGIFTMRTAENARGQGHASLILAQLLKWGQSLGAHSAFLQVDLANEAALRVYRRFGFAPRYAYWQRIQAAPSHG